MSDLNLTLQDNGGVYLAITETPAVVTLGQAVISGALASTVTVSNVVSVSVVTMPSITVTPAAVTTVAGTVTANTYNGLNWIYVAGSFDYSNGYDTTPTLYLNTYFKRVSEYRWESFDYIAGEDKCTAYIIQEQDNGDQGSWRLYVNYQGLGGSVGIASGILAEIALDSPNIYSKFPPQNGWGIRTDLGFTGSVSVNYIQPEIYQSQITNSVTIGSLPAISGTVTANVANSITVGSLPVQFSTTTIGGTSRLNVTLSSATTVGATAPSYGNLSGGSDGTNFRAILTDTSGRTVVTVSNFPSTQLVSLASLPSLAAGTAQIGSVTASISETVTASITNSVTIGSLPRPTWTDYSGTIVTAGEAVTAINTTTRSYLLAQVTTGQMFVNIGATATTLNSVYFSAGQGFAWETSVPQGIVSIISSVTGTNYVLKDG